MKHFRQGERMKKLLVIADDFTGALDTGIQFASYGARTEILTDIEINFKDYPFTEVFIVDTETRHLKSKKAYETVYLLTQNAVNAGIEYLYKKTDSGMRGNIAAELTAVLDASGSGFLAFLPAFPEMNRTVEGGVSYVDGVPIEKSVFGQDPFEPVTHSRIREMFENQKIVKEYSDPEKVEWVPGEKQIAIFDSVTDDDLKETAVYLQQRGLLKVAAGCAGCASVIAEMLNLSRHEIRLEKVMPPLLIVCGSMNEISKKQLAYAQSKGYTRITLSMRQQLEDGYLNSESGTSLLKEMIQICRTEGVCMIDTTSERQVIREYMKNEGVKLEKVRTEIAERLAEIMEELTAQGPELTVMVIGGDTLIHFVRKMKCRQISLLCELEKGVVYSRMKMQGKSIRVISKSGGFGDEALLVRLIEGMNARKSERRNENADTILPEDARQSIWG